MLTRRDAGKLGKTTAVQWDRNSLVINGSRVIIYSGEFHYPRLPVPELWPDIFEKFRASGFNAVSIYFFWSYHSSSPTAPLDFSTGAHDIQRMLDYAAAAGIYVIARPGPYIHGETNAGGVGLWTTTGAHGVTRSSSSANLAAWRPYVLGIGEILARNGVDKGGPVILVQHENEFVEDVHDPNNSEVIYMEQIATAFDDAGVTVPSTHNEKGMRGQSWSTDFENVGGAVNVYGLDSYPNGFDCSNPNSGFTLVRNYYQWFQNYSFTQPSYMAEFQVRERYIYITPHILNDDSSIIPGWRIRSMGWLRLRELCITHGYPVFECILQEPGIAESHTNELLHDIWWH